MSDHQPAGDLEFRTATQVGVSWPNRSIDLVVMPYESEAVVPYRGRVITEVCSRGAFDGIERRANRVRVNRDHDVTRVVGRAVAFHPSHAEGLIAELRIARTSLGDETLALADEEILDASAGFLPMPRGERWEGRDRRRLTKVWLGHIAMTPDPVYHDARVLAVRHAEPSGPAPPAVGTPVLDGIRLRELAARYGLGQ
jgi:HK97 family phage prohead protease